MLRTSSLCYLVTEYTKVNRRAEFNLHRLQYCGTLHSIPWEVALGRVCAVIIPAAGGLRLGVSYYSTHL